MKGFLRLILINFVLTGYFLAFSRSALAQDYINTAQALSKAFEQAAKGITPSLVSISSLKQVRSARLDRDPRLELFREFFGDEMFKKQFEPEFPGGMTQNGLGSGFIWDQAGHILTNNHVIAEADQVKVRLQDKREFTAKVIGTDPQTDIAVLKIEAGGLVPVKAGNSDSLSIGEWVVAAGNPFGLDHSITAGIVSAKGRSVTHGDQYEDFIQTDAAINVGNSGGPLLNLAGEVIGINTMILSRTGGNHGIGFAIPINQVKSISKQLISTGSVARGWLGVAIQDLNEDLRNSFQFSGEGVLVGDVTKDGPADRGGLEPGDIIVEFDGSKMSSANQLRNAVAAANPDSSVEVLIIRSGKERKLNVRLDRREDSKPNGNRRPFADTKRDSIETLGLELTDINEPIKRRRHIDTDGKVMIVKVLKFSPADNAGLQPEDVILKVGDIEVESVAQLKTMIEKSDLKKGIRLVVETGGMKRFVFVRN